MWSFAEISDRARHTFWVRALIAVVGGAVLAPSFADAAERQALVLADAQPTVVSEALGKGYRERGFAVQAMQPDASGDVVAYAESVARKAREMMAAGVEAADITIVASGDATSAAVLASAILGRLDMNYVLVGGCDPQLQANYRYRPSGRMLSLVEPGSSRSCRPEWSNAPRVSQRRELDLATTGFAAPGAPTLDAMVQWSQGEYLAARTDLIVANTR
ncbi:hypothetical protein [Tahibacter amnicola]|uniref:Uncharacterized protein n=1 Tax=Tahibacter amnicola TaxID=2976241 RepID=A0ABY6BN11_9GAMM|nr:hypothetical protein [Tahibacter amnicola]UXI69956.1 hypothetical protein N4264_10115 [Tahibacter amnicola]